MTEEERIKAIKKEHKEHGLVPCTNCTNGFEMAWGEARDCHVCEGSGWMKDPEQIEVNNT